MMNATLQNGPNGDISRVFFCRLCVSRAVRGAQWRNKRGAPIEQVPFWWVGSSNGRLLLLLLLIFVVPLVFRASTAGESKRTSAARYDAVSALDVEGDDNKKNDR